MQGLQRGQLFAVMDGVGSAPKGMRAAQYVADKLTKFYTDRAVPDPAVGITALFEAANCDVHSWGLMPKTDTGGAQCR